MTIYQIYYLSEKSTNIKPCNNDTIQFFETATPNVYTCLLCLKSKKLLGTATLATQNGVPPTLDIQFACTTNAIASLTQSGGQGVLSIFRPRHDVQNLFMNYLLSYP